MEIVYTGKLFRVIHKKNKQEDKKIFEIVERPPGVRLLFINTHDKILLTNEYRSELWWYDYRLPWGKTFDTISEYEHFLNSHWDMHDHILYTACKEWKEETWITTIKDNWKIVHIDTLGATIKRDLYYLSISQYDNSIMEQELEDGEDITVERYSKNEIKQFLLMNKISESRTKAFLYDFIYQWV